jgi:SAM-dependent methyltransferase
MEDGQRTASQYDAMGASYAAHNSAGSYNAYYERPATIGLLGEVSGRLLLDRGCFHYLPPDGRDGYAAEARRVLRPGGRFLLRACRTAAGVANDLSVPVIERVFAGWSIESITPEDIVSDTRRMPSLTVRLVRPQRDP